MHGDSHYFRIDKPLLDAQGRRLENFTRVETFGDNQANGNNDVHWVKVARRSTQPRRVRVPAADRPRQPNGGPDAVARVVSQWMLLIEFFTVSCLVFRTLLTDVNVRFSDSI